jgi:hypothetical protein
MMDPFVTRFCKLLSTPLLSINHARKENPRMVIVWPEKIKTLEMIKGNNTFNHDPMPIFVLPFY